MTDLETRVKALEYENKGLQAALEALGDKHTGEVLPRLTRLENAVEALTRGKTELARHALDRRRK